MQPMPEVCFGSKDATPEVPRSQQAMYMRGDPSDALKGGHSTWRKLAACIVSSEQFRSRIKPHKCLERCYTSPSCTSMLVCKFWAQNINQPICGWLACQHRLPAHIKAMILKWAKHLQVVKCPGQTVEVDLTLKRLISTVVCSVVSSGFFIAL